MTAGAMETDWIFEGSTAAVRLGSIARRVEEALDSASAALERGDEDALSEGDRHALEVALEAIADSRRLLRSLDTDLLSDAQRVLQETLYRSAVAEARAVAVET